MKVGDAGRMGFWTRFLGVSLSALLAAAGFFTVRASPEQVFTGEADLAGAIVVISPIIIRRVD